MKAELKCTKNYDMFEMHECNRDLHDAPVLLASMKEHGFMPSSPLQCKRNGHGTLKVIRGHHRLDCAKRLGIPVWYVVDESNTDIFTLEGSFNSLWSGVDFLKARAKAGDEDCQKVVAFQKKHKLTLGAAAALVGGQSAGSGNKVKQIKRGIFHVGDMTHAKEVTAVTDLCRELNIPFATATGFVRAVSMALRIPELNRNMFAQRLRLHAHVMSKRGTVAEYLQELEALYNYSAKKSRLPLAFRAKEEATTRGRNFGKPDGKA